jgi:hypothetical protein
VARARTLLTRFAGAERPQRAASELARDAD